MTTTIINVPAKSSKRFEKAIDRVSMLSEGNLEIFWDDVITAMENRLKVYKA
jgi:hypothetical protein